MTGKIESVSDDKDIGNLKTDIISRQLCGRFLPQEDAGADAGSTGVPEF